MKFQLSELVSALFPFKVSAYETDSYALSGESLHIEEGLIAQNFSGQRLLEFIAGRCCARLALNKFNYSQFPILMGENGCPIWPEGYTGSIAHTSKYCVAVVCSLKKTTSIGVDVEELLDFPLEIKNDLLRSDEDQSYSILDQHSEAERLAIFFVIKESVYKAAYPIFKNFLEFHDVKVSLGMNSTLFSAAIVANSGLSSEYEETTLHGNYCIDSNRVYAVSWFGIQ